jgi:hypothetical protein
VTNDFVDTPANTTGTSMAFTIGHHSRAAGLRKFIVVQRRRVAFVVHAALRERRSIGDRGMMIHAYRLLRVQFGLFRRWSCQLEWISLLHPKQRDRSVSCNENERSVMPRCVDKLCTRHVVDPVHRQLRHGSYCWLIFLPLPISICLWDHRHNQAER